MTNIDLNSVGSTLTSDLLVFPIDCSEAPETASDAEEMSGVHLYDVDNEWYNSLSHTDLTNLFNFIENTNHLISGVYNNWRDNILGDWHLVNVIDCTEGSNLTEPTEEDFAEVVPTEEELNSPAMDALVEHLLNGGTI